MQSHQITLNGQPFHYRTWGPDGAPAIVLLHGFPEYSGAWQELAAHLPEYRLIAPDQRGYGQSWAPEDTRDYATGKLVGDMAALIAALGTPAAVLGHDWGAAVAYGLAMFHAPLVKRLIIMNGVHPVPFQAALAAGGAQSAASQYILWLRREGSDQKLAENDFAKLLSLFSANMDLSWLSGAKLAEYKAEWARPGRMRGMVNWYRASPLAVAQPGQPLTDLPALPLDKLRITMPHLLIWGANDTALLPEASAGLEDLCTDLTRHTLEGADHWLHHQQPEKVAQAIRAWL